MLFSIPSLDPPDGLGIAFPLSLESLSVMRPGLRWELLEREDMPIGLNLRAPDRFFLMVEGYGIRNGDDCAASENDKMLAEADLLGVEVRDGESGELGDGDADLDVTKRKVGPLEGERERERRNCLKAELVFTWRMCVGDGKCKVPPTSPCGEYVATMRREGQNTPAESGQVSKNRRLALLEVRSSKVRKNKSQCCDEISKPLERKCLCFPFRFWTGTLESSVARRYMPRRQRHSPT